MSDRGKNDGAEPPLIKVSRLVRERSGREVLRGIDLEVRRGEVVALAGANGSGKSTLLAVLAGHLAPHGGVVKIAGKDVTTMPDTIRRRVGYVPEDLPRVEGMTAEHYLSLHAEFLGLPRSRWHAAVDTVLAQVGLAWHGAKPVQAMSGGERRRVELAQALLGERDVLLLDEPFGGVDPGIRDLFSHAVGTMTEGRAVLLGTHRLDEADGIATRLLILSRGAIVASLDMGRAGRMEHVVLEVEADPRQQEALAENLRFTDGVDEVTLDEKHEDRASLWIRPSPDSDPRAAVARAALAMGLGILSLTTAQPRLYDAYRRWHERRSDKRRRRNGRRAAQDTPAPPRGLPLPRGGELVEPPSQASEVAAEDESASTPEDSRGDERGSA